MPPLPAPDLPRIVTYYQTHHSASSGSPISILPLVTEPGVSATHVILAAVHVNAEPAALTLNDHSPDHPRFATLWAELKQLQAAGVPVLAMLGGAAKGTYSPERLGSPDQRVFEAYYAPLRDMLRAHGLDGVDLDVEEPMSLAAVVRLVDRLRADFGPSFLITLAPVAAALLGDDDPRRNMSGFGYDAFHALRGHEVAWYNAQFYCGWGDCSSPAMYELILSRGRVPPSKLVVGLVTNPANGSGWVPWEILATVLPVINASRPDFGGVMGWEYFNSLPGGEERPWEWAMFMTALLRGDRADAVGRRAVVDAGDGAARETEGVKKAVEVKASEADADGTTGDPAPVPGEFDYYSDGSQA